MKTSVVITTLNEEKTIALLLESLSMQTVKPDEIIIVDGGSTDKTVEQIKRYKVKVKLAVKSGNRAVGRNEAIKLTSGDIILSADAGCVFDKNWVKNIVAPFRNPNVDVVAGYYAGLPKTVFQKCLIPYVLVMPDRVDPHTFLPASRSMAFRKSVWKKAGGFPESLSHNEDYALARNLRRIGAKIVFVKQAIVYWQPRKNMREAFYMFYRFALGDAEARIIRPKVILLFTRYIVGCLVLVGFFFTRLNFLFFTFSLCLVGNRKKLSICKRSQSLCIITSASVYSRFCRDFRIARRYNKEVNGIYERRN